MVDLKEIADGSTFQHAPEVIDIEIPAGALGGTFQTVEGERCWLTYEVGGEVDQREDLLLIKLGETWAQFYDWKSGGIEHVPVSRIIRVHVWHKNAVPADLGADGPVCPKCGSRNLEQVTGPAAVTAPSGFKAMLCLDCNVQSAAPAEPGDDLFWIPCPELDCTHAPFSAPGDVARHLVNDHGMAEDKIDPAYLEGQGEEE